MVKPPTLIARVFRAGAALAATAAISSILTPTAGRAEGSNPLDAASINGSGFYRFKIGSFQAAVISDGFGEIPVGASSRRTHPKQSLLPRSRRTSCHRHTGDQQHPRRRYGERTDSCRFRIWRKTRSGFRQFRAARVKLATCGYRARQHRFGRHLAWTFRSHRRSDYEVRPSSLHKSNLCLRRHRMDYWTGDRYESDVMRSPMPNAFKQGTLVAARENLPPIAAVYVYGRRGPQFGYRS